MLTAAVAAHDAHRNAVGAGGHDGVGPFGFANAAVIVDSVSGARAHEGPSLSPRIDPRGVGKGWHGSLASGSYNRRMIPWLVIAALTIVAADPAASSLAGARGRLRGEAGFSRQEPIVGAAVVLVRDGDPGLLAVGTTDTQGYFRFESIPEGSYTVNLLKEGADPVRKSGVAVKPPIRAIVDLVAHKSNAVWTPPTIDLAAFEAAPGNGAPGAAKPEGGATAAPAPIPGDAATAAPAPTPGDVATAAPAPSTGDAATAAPAPISAGIATAAPAPSAADGAASRPMRVLVTDVELKPIHEAQVFLRSRGPVVNPIRAKTGHDGWAEFPQPQRGEYLLRIAVPGYLPVRVDRLGLGATPVVARVVLTARPLEYPASPAELLPEEKPAPPEGFPGGRP